MYHTLWANWYLPAALPALERLLFARVKPPARVLDLCCGSGHVTKELVQRGYRVTGIDNSAKLIALAQSELPGTDLRVQDARNIALEARFDAVLSTYDSMNHILTIDDLSKVFSGVRQALKPGGLFVFDMNLEEAYALDLRQWLVDVGENAVGISRGRYDPTTHFARTEMIWFVRNGSDNCWRQHQSVVEERCYEKREIMQALQNTGFRQCKATNSFDAGITADLGQGRIFLTARS